MATHNHLAGVTTTPYWMQSAALPAFPALDRSLTVDVVIVGGGVTGLTAAYLLTKAGRTVAVLERDRCGRIDTGHTTAHLTMVTDLGLGALVSAFGRDHAQAVWDAGLAAIAQIDEIVRSERLACGFTWVPGYLHAPIDARDDESAALRDEADLARALGFDASFVGDVPVVHAPGVRYEHQARIHPLAYLSGLARAVIAGGGRIFEHSAAEEFSEEPLTVTSGRHTLSCQHVVIATHTPLVGNAGLVRATLLQTKLALYSSYVVAAPVAAGVVPDALFWDTGDPYSYLRIDDTGGEPFVIYGGQDHKTGQIEDEHACYDRLAASLKQIVPVVEPAYRWSGQVIETADGLPLIGEISPHQFSATGFAGNGMTFGTLSGMMACDHVLGRSNPWTGVFDIGRTRIRGGLWDYIKENSDYPYYLIRDRFAGTDTRFLRDVPRGEGRVLDLDGQRVAAFRQSDGATILRSAICPHMGCVVGWNEAERTWDCPCHGSRFRPTGEVMSGPAESPLAEFEPQPSRPEST